MSDPHVVVDRAGPVLSVRLNRPEKKNALSSAMYAALAAALLEAEEDSSVRVVLFRSTGDYFTSGNDLFDFINHPPTGTDNPVTDFLVALSTATKPLIAAVRGPAIGVGVTMLLHCDLVCAASAATFVMPFVDLGLCPEAASSYLLPRLMGHQRAAELLLFGETIDAARARELGLVNTIVDGPELDELAMDRAQSLAGRSPAAVRATKELLKRPVSEPIRSAMEAEGRHFTALLSSPEALASMTAVQTRSKPG
jgi:enoyl-CoA hydratase/carnithine racemase